VAWAIPGIGEDWDFFLQLSKKGALRNLPEPLYLVRLNPKSVTNNRYTECTLNYQFSIHRYQNNLAVTAIDSFKNRQKQSFLQTSLLRLDNLSLMLYRKGLQSYILQNKWHYFFYLVLAGVLSPTRVQSRVARIVRYGF